MSNKIKLTKDNTFYICHNCCDYKTYYKHDMNKHYKATNKCKTNYLPENNINYEDKNNLSINRRYVFLFDHTYLTISDYIYIITNYCDDINYIQKDFKNNKLLKNSNETVINKNEIEKDNKQFICNNCKSEFKSKQNLIKHVKNIKLCENKRVFNLLNIDYHSDENKNLLNNKEEDNDVKIVNNHNNLSNIQNNYNMYNNDNSNNFNVGINDFLLSPYSYKHISDEDIKDKDFFIYDKLLPIILKNRENHNIYFDNNNAIVYSNKNLKSLPQDKAGYMILYKLSIVMDNFIEYQDERFHPHFDYIKKYYRILLGQYKHDTTYREYDINQKKFTSNIHTTQLRSRDIYLSDIVQICNKHEDDTRNIYKAKELSNKNLITVNPNIEDFASTRLRYKDLKDKD